MINTTLCYITQGDQVLMLHRVKKKNDINQGKWIGVGGKCQEGESPEDCLLREVREETGLTLTQYRYCGIITFVFDGGEGEYMHLFQGEKFQGSMIACDEGDLQWLTRAQLDAVPKWAGDQIFLDLMWKKVPFFSLKLVYAGDRLIQAVLNGKAI